MVSQATLDQMNQAGWSIRSFDDSGTKHLLEQRDQSYSLEAERATGCTVLFSMAATVTGLLSTVPLIQLVAGPACAYSGYKAANGLKTKIQIESARKKIFHEAEMLYYVEQMKVGIQRQIRDLGHKGRTSTLPLVARIEKQWTRLEQYIYEIASSMSRSDYVRLIDCRTSVLRTLSSYKTALNDKATEQAKERKQLLLEKLQCTLEADDDSDIVGRLITKKTEALKIAKDEMKSLTVYCQSFM